MPTSDLSTWPTKDAAAATIGVSTKTIEQFVKQGKIRQERWRRPTGGQWLSVYNPEDVALVKRERDRPPIERTTTMTATVYTPQRGRRADSGLAAVVRAPAAPSSATIDADTLAAAFQKTRLSEKLVLTIPEAVEYSGLSETLLRRQCMAGKLGAKNGRWRISREQLLALVSELFPPTKVQP